MVFFVQISDALIADHQITAGNLPSASIDWAPETMPRHDCPERDRCFALRLRAG
jgi:hypothetical protein